jgi:hypothetical protein
MYWKLMFLILGTFVIAASLLALRQQRFDLSNDLADLHAACRAAERRIWQAQVDAAELTAPGTLRNRIGRTTLAFEPARPGLGRSRSTELAGLHFPAESP